MSLDHLVPVSKGGAHIATNLRLAHLQCNIRRGPGRLDAQLLLT
jgi:5-methylcytosine-specific restriction endonuclease McrA